MNRLVRLQWCLALALGVVVLRLAHLQLIRGSHYRKLADANRLRLVPDPAPRGPIVDREGRILAGNQTIFRVALVPQELDELPVVLTRLGTLLGQSPSTLQQTFTRERTLPFVPATVVRRIPKDTALRLEEERWRLPGVLVKPETARAYPLQSGAAHLLGYLSQPTPEQFAVLKAYGVRPRELVGRMGLEQTLDHVLRGRSGGLMVEVDHRGRQVRVLGRRPPVSGGRVVLTIDAALQSLIEQSFGAQAGACVVLDPSTGEVLAMVSRPGFEPEAFALQDGARVTRWIRDEDSAPLLNRAAMGEYLPGSIAKLITASAALEQHLIAPTTVFHCPGALQIGDRVIHCWNRDGHGPLTLPEALMQSCNVYFMQVGLKLGAGRLLAAMKSAGWSQRSGWLLEERAGHLPTRRLSGGEVALLAIGQGEVLITPLQAARMAAAFANRGWLVEPWVVKSIDDRPQEPRTKRHRVAWSAQTLETVRLGMEAVVRDAAGTGHRAFHPNVSIAGKTGTAQTHVPGQPHGWFVGFCPVEEPRVAMAIVAEHGGSGGDLPAEIARTICEYVAVAHTL